MSRPGRIVITRTGLRGRVYNDEEPINGKLRVHLEEMYNAEGIKVKPKKAVKMKILASPGSLRLSGYFD